MIEDMLSVKKQIKHIGNNIGNQPIGISTGLKELDEQLRGLEKGDYIIVAGRPSMGKSSFATTIAANVGKESRLVIFSLEMNATLFAERLIANVAEVNYHDLKLKRANEEDYKKVDEAVQYLQECSIGIDDASRLNPKLLQQKLEQLTNKGGVDCCIIDYLQLMTMWRSEGRQQEISDISRELKAVAKDFNIPLVVLAQLNRYNEMRQDKRPRLADLRESGSLEQDAHKVLLLYRAGYYDDEDVRSTEIIVAKNRSGPTGTVKCHWIPDCMKFVEIREEF